MTESPSQTASISSIGAKQQVSQINNNKRYGIYSITDKGESKEENQDNLLIRYGEASFGNCVLMAVADGVGGIYGGNIASKAAIDKLSTWWDITLKTLAARPGINVRYLINESLSAAVSSINCEIYEAGKNCGRNMGTTLSLLFILDDWYCIQHVGDSRIYKLNSSLVQLTEDDSMLNQYIKSGRKSEIKDYMELSNTLTKCLGIRPNLDLHEQNGRIANSECFMLCTDGFFKRISNIELYRCMQKCAACCERSHEFIRQVLSKARSRGELDDITAVVAVPHRKINDSWQSIIKLWKGW